MWNIVIACEKYAEKMRGKKYSYPLNSQASCAKKKNLKNAFPFFLGKMSLPHTVYFSILNF